MTDVEVTSEDREAAAHACYSSLNKAEWDWVEHGIDVTDEGVLRLKRVAQAIAKARAFQAEQIEAHRALIDRLTEERDEARRALAERTEAWVPVSERAHFHLSQGTKVLAYHQDWGVSEGWVNSMGSVSGNWAGGALATHWMPLPQPPESESK